MTALRTSACVLIGGVALAGGLSLAPSVATGAAATGISAAGVMMALFTSELFKAVGGGILGNAVHNQTETGITGLTERLKVLRKRPPTLPENHDLARALRLSELDALDFIFGQFEPRHRQAVGIDHSAFSHRLFAWTRKQRSLAEKSTFLLNVSDPEGHELVEGLAPLGSIRAAIIYLETEIAKAARAELEAPEVAANLRPPAAFLDFICDPGQQFGRIAIEYFLERLKTNERLRAIIFAGELQSISTNIDQAREKIREQLSKMEAPLSDMLDRLTSIEKTLSGGRQHRQFSHSLTDAIISASTRADFLAEIARIVGACMPDDNWKCATTSKDVRDRVQKLLSGGDMTDTNRVGGIVSPFVGREDELEVLDSWVENHPRGVMIVCAPSGAGKSALIAKWTERQIAIKSHVVRHFVSSNMVTTNTPASSLQHLLVQLREIDRVESGDQGAAIPVDEKELNDALYTRLKQPVPGGRKLIVVVDGMDELVTPFSDTFIRDDLGEGVYVIVSRRAEKGATPPDLVKWERLRLNDGTRATRYDLPPMSVHDVMAWLENIVGHTDEADMVRMAERLAAVTDGLALFLKEVLYDLSRKFRDGSGISPLDHVMRLSAPFAGFLKDVIDQVLDDLPDRDDNLFALAVLAQALGAMTDNELKKVTDACSGHAKTGVSDLHPRLKRWLSWRSAGPYENDRSDRLAFDHPRLASEFLVAVGKALQVEAYNALMDWCEGGWHSTEVRKLVTRGAEYPLRYLPQHHLRSGDMEASGKLLSEVNFIVERFESFDGREATDMMCRDWRAWGKAYDSSKTKAL